MKPWLVVSMLLVALPVRGWDSALSIEQAAPQRLITVPAGQDAAEWARANNLKQWQQQTGIQGQQYLTTRMDDQDWYAFREQCGEACQLDNCQGIRTLNVAPMDRPWLVPAAPDLERTLAGQPDSCPADQQAQPWQGQWPAGSDLRCWQMQLGNPCQIEQTPAEYLKEQWRPNQLLVVLPAGGQPLAEFAAERGLVVLEENTLQSTGDRMVLFQRAPGAPPLGNLLNSLGRDPAVTVVQRELAYFTLATKADPLAGFNYGPGLTAAAQLAPRYSGKSVTVAVIDTGLDQSHPELSGRVASRADFTRKGYGPDAHGTAVAAIIAGARGNGVGAFGVAPDVAIHSYKACHPHEAGGLKARCWSSSLIKALDAAVVRGDMVINLSLGGPPSPILHRVVKAAEKKGLVVVSAAGNGGPNARPVYPAAWPEALAVTAIGADRQLYKMANRGRYVQIAAPGVDIITAGPDGAQPVLSGTSMATAHVSGIAAQLKQIDPESDGGHVTALMVLSSEDLGDAGPDTLFGSGLVNACRSAMGLKNVKELCAGQLRNGGL